MKNRLNWKYKKIFFVLTIFFNSLVYSYGQNEMDVKVSINIKNAKLTDIFSSLKNKTNFDFTYGEYVLNKDNTFSLNFSNEPLKNILDFLSVKAKFDYTYQNKSIIISKTKNQVKVVSQNNTIEINGTVTDENGLPLPGASIVEKGTSNGVSCDLDGKFRLQVKNEQSIIKVSFISYLTQEIKIGKLKNFTIKLITESNNLEEVIVVGYGSKQKKALTGAVSTINAKELSSRPITQASQIFYGLVPGVFANSSTGEAGNGQTTFRVRGVGTLNDANALILVDGIEAPMDNINPDDIETVTVLKDASAAAIYGSRAANGVVLITTKRSKFNSETKIDYTSYFGSSAPTVLPKMVTDNATYLQLYKEAALNTNISSVGITDAVIERYKNSPSTNWFDVIFDKKAPIQQHSLGLRSGNENLATYVSIGYLNQDGIIKKTGFERINSRINLDAKINKYFKAGTSLSYSLSQADLATKEGAEYRTNSTDVNSLDGKGSLAFEAALTQHPIVPVYDNAGRYATLEQALGIQRSRNNGQAILDNETLKQKDHKLLGNIYLSYEPIEKLVFKTVIGINNQQTGYVDKRKQYQNYDPFTGNLVSTVVPGSLLTDVQYFSQNVTTLLQASYDKKIGNHTIGGIVGFNQESSKQKSNDVLQTGFASTSLINLGSGSTNLVVNTNQGEWAIRSFFGRINYEFANKYLFEANVRHDGSSRFGSNNRFGIFPSFSTGWIASNEGFWNKNIVNFLKVRVSHGTLGNQNTDLYPFASQLGLANNYPLSNTNISGGAINTLGNPDLKWESTTTTDIGLNIHLFKSKLTIEADYFNRDTKDILTAINNPLTLGITSPTIKNAASVNNKGFEVSTNYSFKLGKVDLSLGGNITYVENKVTSINPDLSPSDDKVELNATSNIWLIRNEPINAIYGYKVEGIFQNATEIANAPNHSLFGSPQPGDFKFQDTNGDGIINNKDKVVLGNRQPKLLYGFNLKVNVKNFDLAALFQGVGTFNTYQARQVGPFAFAGIREYWMDRWTPENPSTTMPRLWIDRSGYNGQTIETQPSSFWVQNLAYLRIKNIQIGYTLPKSTLSKLKVDKIRFFVNAQNLITFSKYKDFDPERLSTQQYVTNSLPQLRIITTGVNLTF